MTANAQLLAAGLPAWVLAFSRTVALLLAGMCSTFQLATADLPATHLREPTGLVLDLVLSAQACLGNEERTLRTAFIVLVAVVGDLWMATSLRSLTVESAGWRLGATWERRLDDRPAAMTAQLMEDGLAASSASALVAELLAAMVRISTLQRPATAARADVFRFELVFAAHWC